MQRMLALSLMMFLTLALAIPRDALGDVSSVPTTADNATASPGMQCRRAIDWAARHAGVPDHLMAAIGRIESGRRGPDGQINPWPWSINAEGVDHVYDTREMAIAAVHALQAQGMRSIDVGCMQVNLHHHPAAFATLEQAFDPGSNAAYAAHFLMELFTQTHNWDKATANYHSAEPDRGNAYQHKVAAVMAEEATSDIALLHPQQTMPRRMAMVGGAGEGAMMLGNRLETARIIPLAGSGISRNLDAYRAAPIRVALQPRP